MNERDYRNEIYGDMVPNFEKIMHVNSSLTDYFLNESSFTMRPLLIFGGIGYVGTVRPDRRLGNFDAVNVSGEGQGTQ
jgi:hypothetical protein